MDEMSVLKKKIFKALVFIFIFGSLSCGQGSGQGKNSRVVIAIDATFVPMSFLNDQREFDGFEVDLIKEVVQNAGFDYELVNVEWGGLFGGADYWKI